MTQFFSSHVIDVQAILCFFSYFPIWFSIFFLLCLKMLKSVILIEVHFKLGDRSNEFNYSVRIFKTRTNITVGASETCLELVCSLHLFSSDADGKIKTCSTPIPSSLLLSSLSISLLYLDENSCLFVSLTLRVHQTLLHYLIY